MKELDDFTIGRLKAIIDRCGNGEAMKGLFDKDEVERLARIALAAKTAEPVAWWTGPEPTLTGELESIHGHETGGHCLPLISISTTSEAALSRETFIFKVANFLCTRRQSVTREVETASMIYDMVNTQVTERQKTSIRDGISELRSHIESIGGFNHDAVSADRTTPMPNSPELPDGWIACAERMPADCQTVLCNNMLTELSGIPFIADYVGMFELYDGTRYEAGFYINRTPQTVTHWQPLPAPPTTEK